MAERVFLQDVPKMHILNRLKLAGGNEIESGKLASPQSSAALAINSFGRFCLEPKELPPLPNLAHVNWPANRVEIEYSARFPWAGGRHPWLDALVQTSEFHIGIECKRFEPYRDKKKASFSDAYWREVWGSKMKPFLDVRDRLREKSLEYNYLDAAQLVKHALGLRTDYANGKGGKPILAYVFVETVHTSPVKVTAQNITAHKAEIEDFHGRVSGAEVDFVAFSYEQWLSTFPSYLKAHAKRVASHYILKLPNA